MTTELDLRGIGMTSQRTRSRLVERLREQGIESETILSAISDTPRHACFISGNRLGFFH